MDDRILPNYQPMQVIDELQAIDLAVGSGDIVMGGATVTAHYTGALASTGQIFQSSHDRLGDQPISFPLSGVIAGWSQGVPGMRVGGTRRLFIPAAMAYGANPPAGSGIPPNADLVFDVEVASVKNMQ